MLLLVWFPDYVLLVIQNQVLLLFSVEQVLPQVHITETRKLLEDFHRSSDEYQKPED